MLTVKLREYFNRHINIVLLLTGIIISILICEITLRILKPKPVSIEYLHPIYIKSEEFGYLYKPYATGRIQRFFEIDTLTRINSMGFHDIEHDPSSDKFRILVVGDSFTAATHVEIHQTWLEVMQKKLREEGYASCEVINLGIDGTGTATHLKLLKKYLPVFRPAIVILAYSSNDFYDIARDKVYRNNYGKYVLFYQDNDQKKALEAYVDANKPPVALRWIFDHSYTFRAIIYAATGPENLYRYNSIKPHFIMVNIAREVSLATIIPRFAKTLLEFYKLSFKYDFQLLIVPMPTSRSGAELKNNGLNQLKKTTSPRLLAPMKVIDIVPAAHRILAKNNKSVDDMFWKYDAHFNVLGNYIIGRAAAASIKDLIKKKYTRLYGKLLRVDQ